MRNKIIALGLIYFLLILFPCCKKTPTSPDVEEVLKPVINSFTASPSSINLGASSTLSWSVSYATQITIDNGIGGVSASGSTTVNPTETTTYTLTASNSAGQVSRSVTVEIKEWTIIELTLTPLPVLFIWNFLLGGYNATFTIIIAETNQVGAQITTATVGGYLGGLLCNEYTCSGGRLDASGTLEIEAVWLYFWCQLDEMRITIKGTDDNGYTIDETWVSYIYWTSAGAQMGTFIRIK